METTTGVRGPVLDTADPGYDARAVYNGLIDRRPVTIVRCADAADVMAVVDYDQLAAIKTAVDPGNLFASAQNIRPAVEA